MFDVKLIYSRCEHYRADNSRDHFYDNNVGSLTGAYDLAYIKALFGDDQEEIKEIEDAAFALGYGPLVECTTVTNFSSQRAFCRVYTFFDVT